MVPNSLAGYARWNLSSGALSLSLMTHKAAASAAALSRAAAFALLLAGAAWPSHALANDRCTEVHVEVDAQGHKVLVDLKNSCEARVGCHVTWTLRCGHGRAEERGEKVWIEGRTDQRVEASAASCGDDDWQISPPRWRCDETHATTTTTKPRRR